MGCESLANPLCGFVLSSSELLTSTTFAETVPCLCSFVRARCHVLPSGHGFPPCVCHRTSMCLTVGRNLYSTYNEWKQNHEEVDAVCVHVCVCVRPKLKYSKHSQPIPVISPEQIVPRIWSFWEMAIWSWFLVNSGQGHATSLCTTPNPLFDSSSTLHGLVLRAKSTVQLVPERSRPFLLHLSGVKLSPTSAFSIAHSLS
jgi:hypothetical protein